MGSITNELPRPASFHLEGGLNDPARWFNSTLESTVKFGPWLAALMVVNKKAWAGALRIVASLKTLLSHGVMGKSSHPHVGCCQAPVANENTRRRNASHTIYRGVFLHHSSFLRHTKSAHQSATSVTKTIRSAFASHTQLIMLAFRTIPVVPCDSSTQARVYSRAVDEQASWE